MQNGHCRRTQTLHLHETMPDGWHIIDDEPDDESASYEEDRLNHTRIRAIAQERRAAHRRLLWARAIVFVFACLAIMMGVDAFRVHSSQRPWFAAASVVFGVLTIRSAARLRGFSLPAREDAATRPDPRAFETLSDGRQFAQRLDELRNDH